MTSFHPRCIDISKVEALCSLGCDKCSFNGSHVFFKYFMTLGWFIYFRSSSFHLSSKLVTLPILITSFQSPMKPVHSSAEKPCLQRETRFLLVCHTQKKIFWFCKDSPNCIHERKLPICDHCYRCNPIGKHMWFYFMKCPCIICFFFLLQKNKAGWKRRVQRCDTHDMQQRHRKSISFVSAIEKKDMRIVVAQFDGCKMRKKEPCDCLCIIAKINMMEVRVSNFIQ